MQHSNLISRLYFFATIRRWRFKVETFFDDTFSTLFLGLSLKWIFDQIHFRQIFDAFLCDPCVRTQDIRQLPPITIMELGKLFHILDDHRMLTSLSRNVPFQVELWRAISDFGATADGVGTSVLARVRGCNSVDFDKFNTFREAMIFFCNVARMSLIPLSDEDIKGRSSHSSFSSYSSSLIKLTNSSSKWPTCPLSWASCAACAWAWFAPPTRARSTLPPPPFPARNGLAFWSRLQNSCEAFWTEPPAFQIWCMKMRGLSTFPFQISPVCPFWGIGKQE